MDMSTPDNVTLLRGADIYYSVEASKSVTDIPNIVFAGVAVLVAVLALIVGVLQLCKENQQRRHTQELQYELLELEKEISEVGILCLCNDRVAD